MRRVPAIGMILVISVILIFTVNATLLPFGSFPQRRIGQNLENSIAQHFLENGVAETGSVNIITSIVWDYRAYDTLGEATVLFTAVCGVIMLFMITKRRD